MRRAATSPVGWRAILGDGRQPAPLSDIAAYSEFMPPPRMVRLPYGTEGESPFDEGDPWGWKVAEHEEFEELRPGMDGIAAQVVAAFAALMRGKSSHGLSRAKLLDNPYWPAELSGRAGSLDFERVVCLSPLALSRTQDDKGRIRWTLFGGSEQGPSRGFWKSFYLAPDRERPAVEALDFFRRLLRSAYGDEIDESGLFHGQKFRILPQGALPNTMHAWDEGPLPSWTGPLILGESDSPRGLTHLLTFRPFGLLPPAVKRAYLAGKLHLLPCPASLIPWGVTLHHRLSAELPLAMQVPLLNMVARHEGTQAIRVPQSGWIHEPRPGLTPPRGLHGPIRGEYRATHRTARTPRDEVGHVPVVGREDKMAHVLFGNSEGDMGLYSKPMARNVQLWTEQANLLLDGPASGRTEIERAARALAEGGVFGYRFQFPAMRVGVREVYWHRPLCAYLPRGGRKPVVVQDAPLGYLTVGARDSTGPSRAVELWPRPLAREPYLAAVELFRRPDDPRPQQVGLECRKLLNAREALGAPLPRSLARRLISSHASKTLEDWFDDLPRRGDDPNRVRRLAERIRLGLEPLAADPPESLTFRRTARRDFEVGYWKTIFDLATGLYPNRNQADCATDPATRKALRRDTRDLGPLGEAILDRYDRSIAAAGMTGKALLGDLPFRWQTDCCLGWSDAWLASQGPELLERNLIVVIPGRDRGKAIIMADHYDTAYMEDLYGEKKARVAAPGADDNTSATAALVMAAPVLLEMAREGRLGCDVWLVHLTGEEFPADSLGARHLASRLVAGDLGMRGRDGRRHDLSRCRVEGLFVLDMVAHQNPKTPGIFQISPGIGPAAFRLALEAHMANEAWNAGLSTWNRRRPKASPRVKSSPGVPKTAPHPVMIGEVRPHDDPRSTLYNADSQIFSDAGIPTVLLMEDYDINRKGYHDSHDVMAGIDLPYGAALTAIAIEAVARAAGAR